MVAASVAAVVVGVAEVVVAAASFVLRLSLNLQKGRCNYFTTLSITGSLIKLPAFNLSLYLLYNTNTRIYKSIKYVNIANN